MGYLDNAGVTRLWAKMKSYVDDKLSSGLPEWTLFGNTTGSTTLTLPSSYNELIASVSIDGNSAWAYSIHITKAEVDNGVQNFYSGFMFHSGTTGGCRVLVQNNAISVATIWFKNADVISKTKMSVYYR